MCMRAFFDKPKGRKITFIVSRILLGLIFLVPGVGKIFNFSGTVEFASSYIFLPAVMVAIAMVIEVVGSLMLIFGYKVRYAVGALALFSLVAAIFFHLDFSSQQQMMSFLRNLALIGGLLAVGLVDAKTCDNCGCEDCECGSCKACGGTGCAMCKDDKDEASEENDGDTCPMCGMPKNECECGS